MNRRMLIKKIIRGCIRVTVGVANIFRARDLVTGLARLATNALTGQSLDPKVGKCYARETIS